MTLMVGALAAGIGFGFSVDGDEWSRLWRALERDRAEVDVVPAGGPLPLEPVRRLAESDAPGETAASAGARASEAAEAGLGIPIPHPRPTAMPSAPETRSADRSGTEQVANLEAGAEEIAQLAPLFLGRVFVHYAGPAGDEVGRGRAERIARVLEDDGYRIGAIRPTGFAIRTSSVRYFHEADRAAAARLRSDLPPSLAESTLIMDFTSYEPRPRPGTIELWLADSGGPAS